MDNSPDRARMIASSTASLSAALQRTAIELLFFVTAVNRASCGS